MTSADDLLDFIGAAPSPYHAAAEAARRLTAGGSTALGATDRWPEGPGRFHVVDGGAIVAWEVPEGAPPDRPFRIVGAHTDSPNLRVKPRPDTGWAGWQQLAVEVYGGALWNSWLDRDLGLSGRVALAGGDGAVEHRLVRVDRPLLRIPQLAIHLDRDVNHAGLQLNPQHHLVPVWGLGRVDEDGFRSLLGEELDEDPAAILAWDVMLHDLTPGARIGRRRELVSSARLDNLASCWAAVAAMAGRRGVGGTDAGAVGVLCLFDHEEVGSTSATGADGALLARVLERSVLARGGDRDAFLRALAGSVCASADMAHATHPNYPERNEPGHSVEVGGGPVLKVNANQRYATDAGTAATMVLACERAGVPHQVFVSRNDQPCGSTIGPVTAARLGIPTFDVGIPQLSMHSARELCGAEDPPHLAAALAAFLAG